ncbi:MAG TPA: MarR family transcriptional regulator [Terriglobia bacterium]|nr:MarR family transcriptional regulator [Terriglobia bacterium]
MPKNTKTLKGRDRRRIETRVWLQILSLESTILSQLNRALGAEFGLSVAKFEFLAQVERYPEGVSLGKISSNLDVTSGNVSGLVRRLLADGLISKKMSKEDRRSFIVSFSPKGKALFDKANVLHTKKLAECFAEFSLDELEHSSTTLRSLSQRIPEKPR